MGWLKAVGSVINLLRSEDSPPQIVGGAVLGCLLAFTPFLSPQFILLYLVIMVVKVNLGAATLATLFFSLVAFLLEPAEDALGRLLLVEADFLVPVWAGIYNLPLLPFTRFYNTVVMGSLVISLILAALVAVFGWQGYHFVRTRLQPLVDRVGFLRWLSYSNIMNWLGRQVLKGK